MKKSKELKGMGSEGSRRKKLVFMRKTFLELRAALGIRERVVSKKLKDLKRTELDGVERASALLRKNFSKHKIELGKRTDVIPYDLSHLASSFELLLKYIQLLKSPKSSRKEVAQILTEIELTIDIHLGWHIKSFSKAGWILIEQLEREEKLSASRRKKSGRRKIS